MFFHSVHSQVMRTKISLRKDHICALETSLSLNRKHFGKKTLNRIHFLLVSINLAQTRTWHAAWWMCKGQLRIVGPITRGQVLDWCPPAVLFYPIRNSICYPTQLLSGCTSHPHRWSIVCFCLWIVCVFVCVCLWVCVFHFVAAVWWCKHSGDRWRGFLQRPLSLLSKFPNRHFNMSL